MSALVRSLESESISIIREAFSKFEKVGLLFSGGKDSTVLLHLVKRALFPFKTKFELVHIDTGKNFPELCDFLEKIKNLEYANMKVGKISDLQEVSPKFAKFSSDQQQAYVLQNLIQENRYQALLGGGRRDEDRERSKEHIFSRRNSDGSWNIGEIDPDMSPHWCTNLQKDEHFRVFPISNWTERDIWTYIDIEGIRVLPIYFSHKRRCVKNDLGQWVTHSSLNLNHLAEVKEMTVRFRTVADITSSVAIASEASSPREVMIENRRLSLSEKGKVASFNAMKWMQPTKKTGTG